MTQPSARPWELSDTEAIDAILKTTAPNWTPVLSRKAIADAAVAKVAAWLRERGAGPLVVSSGLSPALAMREGLFAAADVLDGAGAARG